MQASATTRKSITASLTAGMTGYLVHRGFSVHHEFGLDKHGLIRADLIAVNMESNLIICEVKSSLDDFNRDRKWKGYLRWCNKFYFVCLPSLARKIEHTIGPEAGIIIPGDDGWMRVYKNARRRETEAGVKRRVITKMAWRLGSSSINNRRKRVFIRDDQDLSNKDNEAAYDREAFDSSF